ncbi:MAG: phosphoglucomutase, alpha-D-glucose phosphate-specific [Acidobacteria bacterium]|nr:MAG: phosphoglucomutase, alpha-D-glucose phosphate-specific [Acidobacteriota bacterium]
MALHPMAGKKATSEFTTDLAQLADAYYQGKPDPENPDERVSFGTSGHRGTSLKNSFNELHIAAITQAVCDFRKEQGYSGPIFIGIDTHALSEPAFKTALEVLAANEVPVRTDLEGRFTPTPVISHAILTFNRDNPGLQADGIVITPSHNPPTDGGFKYNPPTGGPASSSMTNTIQARANQYLERKMAGVHRIPFEKARRHSCIAQVDLMNQYLNDLPSIINLEAIKQSGLCMGVDPLGGAGVHYWEPLVEKYGLNIEVVNKEVDPSFSFMCIDKDGKIRMDCSSPYAMAGLIALKDRYDIAFGNDPDTDRHGIVCPSAGLMNPNHYLSVAIDYLYRNRPQWKADAAIGKTLVSSAMIDRVAVKLKRAVCEVPVGFKWFVDGLLDGSFGFGGEESAGASFLKKDGSVWTTDKDGIILNLLAAEMTAVTGKDPGAHYQALTAEFGTPHYERLDTPASKSEKELLKGMSPADVSSDSLAGEAIQQILTEAPGNKASIGGLKVVTENGWFAARPSGTEDINKLYAESFKSKDHLKTIQEEAKEILSSLG